MTVSKVFMICNAYESGYGHGLNMDGKNGKYFSDPEHNEAYQIGYKEGFERAGEVIDITGDIEPAVLEAYSLLQISTKNRDAEWESDRRVWLAKWEAIIFDQKYFEPENNTQSTPDHTQPEET